MYTVVEITATLWLSLPIAGRLACGGHGDCEFSLLLRMEHSTTLPSHGGFLSSLIKHFRVFTNLQGSKVNEYGNLTEQAVRL